LRLLLLVGAAACALVAHAQSQPAVTAEQVQAAYLHKFLGYVDWPPDAFSGPAAPFVVGVAESAPGGVYAALQQFAQGHPVQGRPVEVRRVSLAQIPPGLHLLYVDGVPRSEVAAALARCQGQPVLTVTALAGPMLPHAMLNFVTVDARVRFEADPAAAALSHLKLSSRLLAVALQVEGARP
jgi:hypothetical protein